MLTIRPATTDDTEFLWRMLTFAASMETADVERAKLDPTIKDYVQGFGRAGDVGVIASWDGRPVAAAWVRLAPDGPIAESKVWTRHTPELAIASERRGAGIGTKLLHALFEAVHGVHSEIALTVRESNPAVHLYERVGFTIERRLTNRVGTTSVAMRWRAPH